MDQISSHIYSDGRLDEEEYYRHRINMNSFIKETDERERLDNPLGRTKIPLGPQAEEEAGQFEEIFRQMQKQMENESKNSSSEMDEHQGELMRNMMSQMGLTKT